MPTKFSLQLQRLFAKLADKFVHDEPVERAARFHLQQALIPDNLAAPNQIGLPQSFLDVMVSEKADPVCRLIAEMPFAWAPPLTTDDPTYLALAPAKVHVELLGPQGVVHSDDVRLGLYGLKPNSEYGLRTHPAEEVFVMLAGQAGWMRGDRPYLLSGPGERSYHPSMLPHATRTTDRAFLSAYCWCGDISTENYVYKGLPDTRDD